jgi:hypothetical protein
MEDARAYQELRVGFTAAVSHELRTPLARLFALLETAALPGTDRDELLAQAREEVEQMTELCGDVLFLELESGREVVIWRHPGVAGAAGGAVRPRTARSRPTSDRIDARPLRLPLRRRMLQTVVEGTPELDQVRRPRLDLTLAARPGVLGSGDGGCGGRTCPALRATEASGYASRGTGLGLASSSIVASAGGGRSIQWPGRGLQIVCSFPP